MSLQRNFNKVCHTCKTRKVTTRLRFLPNTEEGTLTGVTACWDCFQLLVPITP